MARRSPPGLSTELSPSTVSALRGRAARDPSWLLALELDPRHAVAVVQGVDPRDRLTLGLLDRAAARAVVTGALGALGEMGGMVPASDARGGMTGPAATGARPPRDLVLHGHGGMRALMEGKPEIPPPKKRKWWDLPEDPDDISALPLVWAQSVVGRVDAKAGWTELWSHRDGATLCVLDKGPSYGPHNHKRILLIGGWDPSEEEHKTWSEDNLAPAVAAEEKRLGRTLTTNEVWNSDDGGETWDLLLMHLTVWPDPRWPDPRSPDPRWPPPRFQRVHTPAFTNCDDGYFYLIGGDVLMPHSQVWRTSRAGDGRSWEYMGVIDGPEVPWNDRVFSMAGSINGILYVMGGQLGEYTDAQNDMYYSDDGGRTGTWKPVHPRPTWEMWSPRGMVYGMPVIYNIAKARQELYLVGGGIYKASPEKYFDGVYKFDGIDWIRVRPDTPAAPGWSTGYEGPGKPKTSGRGYHNVVLTPPRPGWPSGLLWVITGSVIGAGSCKKILVSKDVGTTWTEEMTADWGQADGSHADAVTVYKGDIIRASGNAFDRSTYRISQISFAKYAMKRRPRVTEVITFPDNGKAFVGQSITLEGEGFSTARAVYIYTGTVTLTYAEYMLALPPIDDKELFLKMPEVKGVDANTQLYIVVVNVDGSSEYDQAPIFYLGRSKK